ncbi:hypothetical protein CKO23_07655 [Thiocystis violacea]|nr:hypothetical protein [Thiocystis violacea]
MTNRPLSRSRHPDQAVRTFHRSVDDDRPTDPHGKRGSVDRQRELAIGIGFELVQGRPFEHDPMDE